MRRINPNFIAYLLSAILVIGAGTFAGIRYYQIKTVSKPAVSQPKDIYLAFSDEIYDTIKQNYWKQLNDQDLTELYRLAISKTLNQPAGLTSYDKIGLDKLLTRKMASLTTEEKRKFLTDVANLVLNNLAPFGRSALYTEQLEQTLNNELNNIDTSTNLYATLGLVKSASIAEVNQAYNQQKAQLEKQDTPEAKQKLALVDRAYEALKTPERQKVYDQTGAEPAVTYKSVGEKIYFIKISRFSTTLLKELQEAASSTPQNAQALILDLRGNIGGDIDQLPYVLGNFLGPISGAFNFYHQGVLTPYQATNSILPQLQKFKQVVILIDNQDQSSTEVMAGAFKKAGYGILLGSTTHGWGSVEKIFTLQNQIDSSQQYSVFLVHTLTLDNTNQPIEGRGVTPDISIANGNWPDQLLKAYHSQTLVAAVKKILAE